VLYDIDFDDLLERNLRDLGLAEGRTLTVLDEEGDRVNVEFLISESEQFVNPQLGDIPSKPPGKAVNGAARGNDVEITNKKRGREEEDDFEFRKKARVAEEDTTTLDENVIVIEDDDTVMID